MSLKNPITSDRILKNRIELYFESIEDGYDLPTVDGLSLYLGFSRTEVLKMFIKYNKAKDYFTSKSITRIWELAREKMGDKKNAPMYAPKMIEFFLKNNFKEVYKNDTALTKEEIDKEVKRAITITLNNKGDNKC